MPLRVFTILCALLVGPVGWTVADDDVVVPFGNLDALIEWIENEVAEADPQDGSVVAVKAFTLGEDGELVPVDTGALGLGSLPIPWQDLEGLDAETVDELQAEVEIALENAMETIREIQLEDLQDLDLEDFGFGDVDFEAFDCGNIDLSDLDLEELMAEGAATVRRVIIGPDGEMIEEESDLDLSEFGDIDAAVREILGDLDLGDLGEAEGVRTHCRASVGAFAIGPNGERIPIATDDLGLDLDAIMDRVKDLFEE